WAALPEHALVILDRGFCSYALFHVLALPNRDRHWIVRARSGRTALTQVVVQRFGPGDALVDLRPRPSTCATYPELPPTLRVRAFWHAAWDTSPGTLPRRLDALLDELALFVLPERRPRHYPRTVKLKMSNYPRNRPHRRRSRAK